jgi:small multidrug resistance pump
MMPAFSPALTAPLLDAPPVPPFQVRDILFLGSTIACEVTGTVLLKQAWSDPRVYAVAYGLYFAGLYTFTLALRTIPLSIAYTTWCSIGIIGVTLGSKFVYAEDISVGRWVCILGTIPLIVGMYVV